MGRFRGVELAELTLSGERLLLRPRYPADADRVPAAGGSGRDLGNALDSTLVERSSERVVGLATLGLGPEPGVWFWVAPDARGHGYAAEATRVLADWAIGVGLRRIDLLCDVRNLASVRTALAAGFGFECVSREACLDNVEPDGRRIDLARFARLADDSGERVAPAFPPLPPDGLSDGVLALRPAGTDDATGFYESEDDVSMRWSFDGERRTRTECERRMTRAGLDWLVGRSAQCTMIDVATGRYAGELQVRFEGPPGVAGVGYTVHPAFRGRGYTTRALRLVVPWVFEIAGFARIELGAKRDNVASQRAAISAGFDPDGVRERRLRNADGTFADEVCFVLVNPRHR